MRVGAYMVRLNESNRRKEDYKVSICSESESLLLLRE